MNKTSSMSMFKIRKFIGAAFLVLAIFTGGYLVGQKGYAISFKKGANVTITRELPANHRDVDFNLFWQVWDKMEEKYFDKTKLNQEEMVYGAIRGMVASIGDPYTAFLPPEQNKVVREDLGGSFEGVGIQIGFRNSNLVVIAPLSDSPAEKSGVKAGDYIVGITDESKGIERDTSEISLHEAVEAIRGKAGTSVKLTLVREGKDEAFDVDIQRAAIDVPTITLKFVGENEEYAFLKLSRFGEETNSEWAEAVREILVKPGVKGLIVDVRNNPGGFLNSAETLASDFLEVGDTVVMQESADGERVEFTVEKIGKLRTIPTVVLINEGSASASEILAGALRDVKKVKLIGATTFGKGTIQEPQDLIPEEAGGPGLHITIAKWLTPSGTWVNDGGLKPDIEVEDNPDTEEDEQLMEAIKALQG